MDITKLTKVYIVLKRNYPSGELRLDGPYTERSAALQQVGPEDFLLEATMLDVDEETRNWGQQP